ncbi:MAG: hypothetical protein ACR2NZ_16470 [Rubripirellula sp.]
MIVDPVERDHQSSRGSAVSFVTSLLFHGLLAFLLWCLVYQVVKQPSITLSASSRSTSDTMSFEAHELPKPAEPVIEKGESPEVESQTLTESPVDVAIKPDDMIDVDQLNLGPPTVEFFGTSAYGNRFVFVLDISYSMDARDGQRFRRACDELVRSVSQLRAGQSYYVFLFCWGTQGMFYQDKSEYIRVVPGHEKKLRRWVYDASLGAGTDPRRALSLAKEMEPDAVFLLSDGQFNHPRTPMSETGWVDADGTRSQISVLEGVPLYFPTLPIHTIAFENPFTRNAMEQIANQTGGAFQYIKTNSHHPVDSQLLLTALRRIDEKHRKDTKRRSEFMTRLSYAREFIGHGELVFAEYIARPVRQADSSLIANRTLFKEVFGILDRELGETRLEDFQLPPELSDVLTVDKPNRSS